MKNTKDLASGLIFAVIGVLYGSLAYFGLPIGGALEMGPGYFPILLSGLLVTLGGVLVLRGGVTVSGQPFGKVPWRGMVMISLAILVFSLSLRPLGLFPASLITASIAALSSPAIKPVRAVVTGFGIAVFCTIIFGYLVKLQIPILGSLFG